MIIELQRKKRDISSTVLPQSPQSSCHLNRYSTELLAQATSALLFGKSSDFSTINLLSSLQHLTLLIIPSVLNFSSLGFHHTTLLSFLFLFSLLASLLLSLLAP